MIRNVALSTVLLVLWQSLVIAQESKNSNDGNSQLTAVQQADEDRVAAMRSPDRGKLEAIFSNDLHYAHSTGVVDTKSSFIDVLTAGKTKYLGYEYDKRDFKFPAPGIATMTGRARVRAATASGTMDNDLSFLAIWRLEDGKWRFLAWQSCKVPPAVAK